MKKLLTLALFALAISVFAETGLGRHKKVYAVPAPGKVVVDGKLDDWDLSPQIESFVMSETREQQNAKFALMYDAEALYVSGMVRDDSPMMNRQDPAVRGNFGWNGDSCQVRLSLDPDDGYPINYVWKGDPFGNRGQDKVALLTLWYYTDEKLPCLQMHRDMGYDIIPGWEPHSVVPNNLYEAAYAMWDDGKGYTFEYKIPWTTLGAPRPFVAGDLAACSVQFNWSNAEGTSTAGGAAWCYDVQLPGFPYQQTGCWGKLIFSAEGNLPYDLVEEGVAPPRPLPLTFEYDVPKDGEVSIVLFNEANDIVRILTASSLRAAGRARDSWDGMDTNGQPLPAGTYTWKGLVRDPLSVKVRLSVHNSGQPGWLTDDTSSSWGGDHAGITTAYAVPGGLLLGWAEVEAGSGIIRTDVNGKKIWGCKVAGELLASDGERFFVGGYWAKPRVRVFDLKDARPYNFGNGNPELEVPAGATDYVTGLEYADGKIYAGYSKSGIVGVYDSKSGDLRKTITLDGFAGRMKWDPKGKRVLAVSTDKAGNPVVVDVEKKSAVVKDNLDAPAGIAVDKDGNIYVANRGELQNVSVFDAKGKYTHSIGKKGGRPARGTYDRDGIYMAGGIAIAEDGRLWVAETTDSPRRHSVWKKTEDLKTEDLKGGGGKWVFDKEFFGGCEYNGFVWMEEGDPGHVYVHGVKWAIDIDKGTWEPVSTMWRSTKPGEVLGPDPEPLRVFTANNGKRYAQGQAEKGHVLYREDGDVFKPFAAVLRLVHPGGYIPGGLGYPLFTDDPEKYRNGYYWWQDKNNDQTVQADEIPDFAVLSPDSWTSRAMIRWLDKDLNLWGDNGMVFAPEYIDENGQPHYDVTKGKPGSPGGVFMSNDETQLYSFISARHFARLDRETGKSLWAYRGLVHWADSLGFPIVKAGLLHGLTYPLGVAGEFTGTCNYYATYHLFTTDGVYVGMIMRDMRDGRSIGDGEDVHASEAFQGQLVKIGERYFLLGGANDGRITEIFGLNSIERLSGGTYIHTPEMEAEAVQARMDYDLMLAKSRKLEIQRFYGASSLERAASVERIVDANRRFTVRTMYDAENMYFRYDMMSEIGLVNSMPDPVFIFKGGNCMDIQIEAAGLKGDDLKMGGDASGGVATMLPPGDPRRLLVTLQDGKPLAMLYRVNVPGTKERIRFTSSSGEGFLDAVDDVTDKIRLEYREQPGGFVAVVTVPQSLLGVELKPQQEVTMDVGYIFGNKEGNQVMSRAYWSNNGFSANVTQDVPNELLMVPEEWGTAVVE